MIAPRRYRNSARHLPSGDSRVSRGRRGRAARNLIVLSRRRHGGAMQRKSFEVIRIPTHGPGDVSGLMASHRQRRARAFVDSRGAGQDRRQWRGQRLHPRICRRRVVQRALATSPARSARGRGQNRVRHVGRHGGRAVAAHNRVRAKPAPRGRRREPEREATERRHCANPRLPAGGDRPGRADWRDGKGCRDGDARRVASRPSPTCISSRSNARF